MSQLSASHTRQKAVQGEILREGGDGEVRGRRGWGRWGGVERKGCSGGKGLGGDRPAPDAGWWHGGWGGVS